MGTFLVTVMILAAVALTTLFVSAASNINYTRG